MGHTTQFNLLWVLAASEPPPTSLPPDIAPPTGLIAYDESGAAGSSQAEIVIMAFADFECPYCGRFARQTLPGLRTEYLSSGSAQLVFRHLPLPIHKNAERAAQAVECAGRQGQFWSMHDQVFANQADLSASDFGIYASAVSMDVALFEECMSDPMPPKVAQDIRLAQELGIRSTPVFLIGRRESPGQMRVESVVVGASPLDRFREALDPLLVDRAIAAR
jgi:protein-disulfide isomerase